MKFKKWLLNQYLENNEESISSEDDIVAGKTVEGLDDFINRLREPKYKLTPTLEKAIREFVIESGCPKIEVMRMSSLGLALHDKVVISESVFSSGRNISSILYVLFHEIAHSYQYKKYGAEKIYEIFLTLEPTNKQINFLRKLETVADRFSIWRLKKLAKSENFDTSNIRPFYQGVSNEALKSSIVMFAKQLIRNNAISLEQKSEAVYNFIVKSF